MVGFQILIHKKMDSISKLTKEYEKLMKEAHKLSHKNRSASDQKYAEADAIGKRIDKLKANN